MVCCVVCCVVYLCLVGFERVVRCARRGCWLRGGVVLRDRGLYIEGEFVLSVAMRVGSTLHLSDRRLPRRALVPWLLSARDCIPGGVRDRVRLVGRSVLW